jgi:hypothetical protein
VYKPPDSTLALWGVLLGAAVALIYFLQLWAMRDQLNLMDKQFAVSHRPWVGIKGLDKNGPLVFDSDGAHAIVDFTIQNGGSSPAINVLAASHLLIEDSRKLTFINNLINDSTFICPPPPFHRSLPWGGFVLPGNAEPFPTQELVAKRQDIPKADRVFVYWIDCLTYADDVDRQHGTSSIYEFFTTNGDYAVKPEGTVEGKFRTMALNKTY